MLNQMTGPAANELLKATARSFYLTLRALPAPVRPQIGLAYLLARTTDTIADTEIVPVEQRLAALDHLRQRIMRQSSAPLAFAALAGHQGAPAERLLLERAEAGLAALATVSARDRALIEAVLAIIISGQELDLRRFGRKAPGSITPLQTAAELDDYTYRVAGCVGEFWTKLCRAHLFPAAKLDEALLLAEGVRFGKGLQLVNILRDLPADLANGRCYLPQEQLAAAGLSPESLLLPENEGAFLEIFRLHLKRAEGHLAAGWRYTNLLPYGQFRVRLACAWPILLGAKTIDKLRHADGGSLRKRVKVSRGEVYGMMAGSVLACPLPFWWRRLFHSGSELPR